MKFINCPSCGHKLLEGENGSTVNVKCNKCKSIVHVNLRNDMVHLSIITNNTAEKQTGTRQ